MKGLQMVLLVGSLALAGLSVIQAGEIPPVIRLDEANAPVLNATENSSIVAGDCDGVPGLRWQPLAGQTATLSLRPDDPLLERLCLYDRLEFEFRIASGSVGSVGLNALGHVSGARRYKVHQWNVAVSTTESGVWHKRSLDLARPNWFPWDNPDGEGERPFLRLDALALEPGTVVELRHLRLTRQKLLAKPDFELPITWPMKTVQPDGSIVYDLTFHVLNVSGRPLQAAARVASIHKKFKIALLDTTPKEMKSGAKATFSLRATMSKEEIQATPELYEEPLEVFIEPVGEPDAACRWTGILVRPFSEGLRKQVIMDAATLQTVRQRVAAGDKELLRTLKLSELRQRADEFCTKKLDVLPRGHAHVGNRYPSIPGTNPPVQMLPGQSMPEAISADGAVRETGTFLAGQTWKEYLAVSGLACESLGQAYLYTADEKYAGKAVELLRLLARQYGELDWSDAFDAPWNRGTPNLAASRFAMSSSYGSNWYFKGLCRMTSCIADSPALTPEIRQEIYRGFVLPYATELMKFPGEACNMTDLTNHNVLLLGVVFDDANLVRWALKSDPGLLSRLRDIDTDGFSSEGRSINYHFAAMQEYLPSIGYLANMGLAVEYHKDRLLAALRMPFQRATLTGHIPTSGDCGRWQNAGRNSLADALIPLFPEENWLWELGASPLRMLTGTPPESSGGWQVLVPTQPRLFKSAGLAVLRQGQTAQEQIQLTFDYGRNPVHGALDRNQISLAAFGRVLTHGTGSLYNVGSGGMTRGTDKRLDSFCSHGSLGHNVILVDQQNQLPAAGKLLAWNAEGAVQFVAARVEGIRPGVAHTRAAALVNGIVILFDEVSSEEEHTYDFAYHNFGAFKLGEGWKATPRTEPLGKTANYENIIDPATAEGTLPLRATWTLPEAPVTADQSGKNDGKNSAATAVQLNLWQSASVNGEVFLGTTGLNNPETKKIPDAAPSLFHRCRGKVVHYLTVLEPYRTDSRVKEVRFGNDSVSILLTDGTETTVSLPEALTKYAAR